MINTELEKFIIKRSVIFFLLFSILIILILNNKWLIIAGFAVGTILSISRFFSYAYIFGKIYDDKSNSNAKISSIIRAFIIFLLNQFLLLPVLYLAYNFNIFIFWGVVSGTLMVCFVLIVNVFTEILGITKNQFFI